MEQAAGRQEASSGFFPSTASRPQVPYWWLTPSSTSKKTAFVPKSLYALAWKKPLQTDVGDSSKPDECVIRLAPVPAPVLQMFSFVGFFGWQCVTAETSQQKLGADHLLSDEIGKR